MSIKTKLLLIVLLTVFAASGNVLLINHYAGRHSKLISAEMFRSVESNLLKTMEQKNKVIKAFVFDYTFWDEMGRFVSSKDKVWAQDNIDSSLRTFDADNAWVLDNNFEYVHHSGKDKGAKLPLSQSALKKIFLKSKFVSFYEKMKGGLFLFEGAGIYGSNDEKREGKKYGYFIVAKKISDEYIVGIGEMLGGKAVLLDLLPSPGKEEKRYIFRVFKEFPGYDGKPVAFLEVATESLPMKLFLENLFYNEMAYSVMTIVVLFSAVLLFVVWVVVPLRKITFALTDNSIARLGRMGLGKNEFGEIARLIGKFLAQRDTLLSEVMERKSAQEKFKSVFEHANEAIFVVQGEKMVLANNKTMEYLDSDKVTLFGGQFINFVHEHDRVLVGRKYEEILKGHLKEARYEFRYLKKDGIVRWANISSVGYLYDGKPAVLNFASDVTERREAEVNQKYAEEKFKLFLTNSTVYIYIKDKEFRYRVVSDNFRELFGLPLEEIIGKTDFELFDSEAAEVARKEDEEVITLSPGKHLTKEHELSVRKNRKVFFSIKFPIFDPAGEVFVGGMSVEMTEKKKVEKQVKDLFHAIGQVQNSVAIFDRSGVLEYANPSFEERMKLSGKDDPSGLGVALPFDKVGEKNIWTEEIKRVEQDGKIKWEKISITPLENGEGKGFRFIVIGEDITEIKKYQEELIRSKELAESASKAKSEFLATISHEIRTPLNAILGATDLLDGYQLTEEQKKYVSVSQKAGETLLSLIGDILDISKIESGRVELELNDFDLKEQLEKTLDMFDFKAVSKGLDMKLVIAPEVPRFVRGDTSRLRQVLANLLGNALKFTEKGSVVLEVKNYELFEKEAYLVFSVADTGIGIQESRLNEIYNAFVQADSSTTRKYGGTGLGLTISKRLIELMGGTIWAESKEGSGSKFYFTAKFGLMGKATTRSEIPKGLKGLKILVSDKDKNASVKIAELLNQGGNVTEVSETSWETEKLIETAHSSGSAYSFICLGEFLRDGNGFVLAEQLISKGVIKPESMILLIEKHRLESFRRAEIMALKAVSKPVEFGELFFVMETVQKAHMEKSPAEQKLGVNGKKLKVLLCEDSPDNRALIKMFFSRTEHDLDTAENGEEAVEKYIHNEYDLVLMDIHMPVKDGLMAAREIRDFETKITGKHIPIIVLTADVTKEAVEKSKGSGCDGYIPKPVKKEVIFALLAKYSGSTVS